VAILPVAVAGGKSVAAVAARHEPNLTLYQLAIWGETGYHLFRIMTTKVSRVQRREAQTRYYANKRGFDESKHRRFLSINAGFCKRLKSYDAGS